MQSERLPQLDGRLLTDWDEGWQPGGQTSRLCCGFDGTAERGRMDTLEGLCEAAESLI